MKSNPPAFAMKLIPMILSTALLLEVPAGHAKEPQPVIQSKPTNAAPLKTGAQRHTHIVEIKSGKMKACKELFAAFPVDVAELYRSANHRNMTTYLEEVGGKVYLITFFEYAGKDYAGDVAGLEAKESMMNWRKALDEVLASPRPAHGWENVEEVFYTEGAADVVPTPEKYARIGMITGLKPEKEAAGLAFGEASKTGSLILIGYLEYVGKDSAADAAAAKAVPVNKRWWKFTDACQQPLPAAAAKGELWDGMEEIHHFD